MSYTLVLLLHSFGFACRSNRRRLTIHYFVRSHVSSDADLQRSPLLVGGRGAGQVLAGSSVEGYLSEYATIPCLGLPFPLRRCPIIDGGRPLISDPTSDDDYRYIHASIHGKFYSSIYHRKIGAIKTNTNRAGHTL